MQPRDPLVRPLAWTLATVLLAPLPAGAGRKPREWNPVIEPANFVSGVDNPYFPLTPGRSYRYTDPEGTEILLIEVTSRRKTVLGIRTTVVIETTIENGQRVEHAENWFAQDREGNVWYFGELTQELENGVPVSSEGSWEAGVDGALPGIIMKARPGSGDTYFQEYAPGVAEDMASVLDDRQTVSTPVGTFSNVLRTKEWTPLEPNSLEHKYYAPGVGLVLEEKGGRRLELVAID